MLKKNYETIDLLKLIASILILAMHCNTLADYGKAQLGLELLARFGVPFFFLSSAFFLFRKSDNGNISRKSLFAYLRRIALLYSLWFLINLPSIYAYRIVGRDFSQLKTWVVLIKNSILSSTFTGSWYLVSSMFSAFFIWLLSKKVKKQSILLISFFLYLLCVCSSVYEGLLPSRVASLLHYFCFPLTLVNGCFYFAIGKVLAEYEDRLKGLCTQRCAFAVAVFSFCFYVLEVFIARRAKIIYNTDCGLFLPLLATALFLLCLRADLRIGNTLWLRKVSTVIFCCQSTLLYLREQIQRLFGFKSSLLTFAIVLLCALLIARLVFLLQRSKHFPWAKYLS